MKSLALVVLFVFAGAGLASAQSSPTLGEIAKKEAERRKAIQKPGTVYTDRDTPRPAGASTPAAPAAPAAAAKPATDEQKPDEKKDEKDEAWWRARITQAREDVRRNEMFLQALQAQINALSADFAGRDDPAARGKIGADRQKAQSEIDRVKNEIDKGKKQIKDIEEEARQGNVPPGWLR